MYGFELQLLKKSMLFLNVRGCLEKNSNVLRMERLAVFEEKMAIIPHVRVEQLWKVLLCQPCCNPSG